MTGGRKGAAAYLAGLALFAAGLWKMLSLGSALAPGLAAAAPAARAAAAPGRGPLGGLALLLLQCLVIIGVTRLCAAAMRRLRQPDVIGEVAGGILLGPSVLGLLWPAGAAALFPASSLSYLNVLSQVGLIVFMFVIGMELNSDALEDEAHTALFVSHASIAAPFLLGSASALLLYRLPGVVPDGVAFTPFCLFMGIAMSITAFPVLARILRDKGISRTKLGATALACAAVDDFTAWCGLAIVAGIARTGSPRESLGVVLQCAAYLAAMLLVARPLVERWRRGRSAEDLLGRRTMIVALLAMLASAFVTEAIGLHALFGAFLAGVVMPKQAAFRQSLTQRLEEFSTVFLLPLFFALSGLRTQIGLLSDAGSWALCGLIAAVAVLGKLGASSLVARWTGKPWRDSLAIGALMNTRGLVELVALNIGYDLGIIGPGLFTMLVLMALATTLMTGPLLERLVPDLLSRAARDSAPVS